MNITLVKLGDGLYPHDEIVDTRGLLVTRYEIEDGTIDVSVENGRLLLRSNSGTLVLRPIVSNTVTVAIEKI